MNTARDDLWTDRDSTAEGEPAARPARTRRALLGGAAGGFALASSGLLLPDRLVEEAEAGHHHRRKKRRRHRARREPSQLGGVFRGIQFTVSAKGGSYPVEFYTNAPGFLNADWQLAGTQTVSPNNPITFQEDEGFGALWIEGRYFLSALNVLPFGTEERVGLWGHIDLKNHWIPGTWWNTGQDFGQTERTIEGSRPVVQDDLRYVHYLRRPDSSKYLRFEVLIQPIK